MELQDPIREGDGHQVTRFLKFLLLWSRTTGHSNYAIKAMAVTILLSVYSKISRTTYLGVFG